MSKISLKPNASGTGVFSLEAPNSNVDRTLTLPDEAGSVLTDVSDIETQVKTATNATGSAPVYACRSWVNFNGFGTASIRDSGNVSSITDKGTGYYVVNLSTAMPDANYSAVVSDGVESGAWGTNRNIIVGADPNSPYFVNTTTTSFQIVAFSSFGNYQEINRLSVAVFR